MRSLTYYYLLSQKVQRQLVATILRILRVLVCLTTRQYQEQSCAHSNVYLRQIKNIPTEIVSNKPCWLNICQLHNSPKFVLFRNCLYTMRYAMGKNHSKQSTKKLWGKIRYNKIKISKQYKQQSLLYFEYLYQRCI